MYYKTSTLCQEGILDFSRISLSEPKVGRKRAVGWRGLNAAFATFAIIRRFLRLVCVVVETPTCQFVVPLLVRLKIVKFRVSETRPGHPAFNRPLTSGHDHPQS
jgi:hypothetical protein